MSNDVSRTLPPVVGAAFVVSVAMYPADVVRAICMANPGTSASNALKGFVATHGLAGFAKQGLAAEICKASFSRSIKFFLQPIFHKGMFGVSEKEGTPFTKGIAGALSTIPEVMVISPFENVKIAQQLDKEGRFHGAIHTAKHLAKSNGPIGGLYIGYQGMQLRQMLWTGGYFMSLDVLRDATTKYVTKDPLARDVLAGFGAGVVGVLLNCWTEVVRSVIQKEAIANTFKPGHTFTVADTMQHFNPSVFARKTAEIVSQKGLAALYSGVGAKCVHLGGSGALLAVLMPRFKDAWNARLDAKHAATSAI